uniref:DNA-directed RNA polymerases I and III subunit RPAC1 n=2 Tax=Kalanchoe fedtschenkoi TaxID=63787 RepID=A0A7N0T814_KALFE
MAQERKKNLPDHLELQRTRVVCNWDAPNHTETVQYSGAYAAMGVDNSLNMKQFRKDFRIEVACLTDEDMEFDMIGIDPAIANAFRRILIAEVPTMAIEKVLVANNTSEIHDEVLAHRLGLIPIKIDPRLFDYVAEGHKYNERNTVVFKLHAECPRPVKKKLHGAVEGVSQENFSLRKTVYSDELQWLPCGSELEKSGDSSSKPEMYTSFNCDQTSMSGFPDEASELTPPRIVLARLGAGQAIELEALAVKGVGKTHAKWSPVATAWYRMLPEVVLLKQIEDAKAEELVKKCPVNVFDIEDIGNGRKKATVSRPRACTLCRECIRDPSWRDSVSLRRVKDHFIFTIESTGALPPDVLFTEAVKILEEKCERVIDDYL